MVPTMASPFQGTLLVPGGDAIVGGCACGQSVGAGGFVVLVWGPAVRVIGCGVKGVWLERGARGACAGGDAGRAELQVLCAVCSALFCLFLLWGFSAGLPAARYLARPLIRIFVRSYPPLA